ncbi:MAG: hypothetical protein ACREJV_12470, partial [Candidatus Rokuibacteriota bacterium]
MWSDPPRVTAPLRLTSRVTLLLFVLLLAGQAGCATSRAPEPGTPPTSAAEPTGPSATDRGLATQTARAQTALELGRALIARGEMAAATVALRKALQLEPNLGQAKASLGLALYGMGDYDGAIDELRALLRA